jgi:hypothetical protein
MSEDGYTMIIKGDDGKYRGYSLSASCDYDSREDIEKEPLEFEADSVENAIKEAQSIYHEYGFNFYNL